MPLKNQKSKAAIAICVYNLELGGAQIQALQYARAIKHLKSYPVYMLGLQKGRGLEQALKQHGIDYECADIRIGSFHGHLFNRLKELLKLRRILRKRKTLTIIPFTYYPNVIGITASFLAGSKYRIWNQRGRELSTPVSKSERIAIRLATHYLGNSGEMATYLNTRHGLSRDRIHILKNALLERTKEKGKVPTRAELGFAESDFLVVFVSNFFPAKDHETAIEALQLLSSSHPDIRMLFVGYAPDQHRIPRLKSLAFDRKLCNKVVFLESKLEISGILGLCDLGLFTAIREHTEGSPNVILDYMNAGLPIVATNIRPVAELLNGTQGSLLVEPGSPHELASALAKVYENRAQYAAWGLENKSFVAKHYSFDKLTGSLGLYLSNTIQE
ncbi:MAG: hypothetical protein CSA96_05255 [Bacteroidetes bacterium]|nr:MAG: hypothetical protein CSA96_05255 [Bacteroidota bacterium]